EIVEERHAERGVESGPGFLGRDRALQHGNGLAVAAFAAQTLQAGAEVILPAGLRHGGAVADRRENGQQRQAGKGGRPTHPGKSHRTASVMALATVPPVADGTKTPTQGATVPSANAPIRHRHKRRLLGRGRVATMSLRSIAPTVHARFQTLATTRSTSSPASAQV